MPETDLLELCRRAVSMARRHGADHAEAFVQSVDSVNSTIEKNDLQISKSQFETSVGVRAFVGRSVGFASTNDVPQLESACRDAVGLAKASPPDPHNVLPEPEAIDPIDDLFDPASEAFDSADAVRRTVEMLSLAARIDRRVILNDGWFSAGSRRVAIANSKGLAVEERGSLFTYGALATARDGDLVSGFDFQFGATRRVGEIDVATPVERVSASVLASLGAGQGRSFKGSILLTPNAVSELLIGTLVFQLHARNVLRGRSRWKDALGRTVAASALSVADDGRLPGGVATAAFDREGVPHRELELICEGALSSFLQNAYTAHAAKVENTGHAAGSARTVPDIGPTNLSISPGEASFEELVADIANGLLVRRFSGNVDPISGDYSGAVKSAQLIERGKLTRAVSGTLIAGSAFEALRHISGISRERQPVFSMLLPYLRIEDVSVTAA
jgi:PmbA protein